MNYKYLNNFLVLIIISWTTESLSQEINIINFNVPLDQRTRNVWRENLFQSEDIFVIKNKREFFEKLKLQGVTDENIELIKSQLVDNLQKKLGVLYSFYSDVKGLSGVVLPAEVKSQISATILNEVFMDLYNNGHAPPAIGFSSINEVKDAIRSWKIKESVKNNFLERIIQKNGNYFLPIAQDTWSYFPKEIKDVWINAYTNSEGDISREAVKVEIKIKNEKEIKKIAKKYSGGRDTEAIERYLRNKLAKSKNVEIIVPLENILQPFIRKNIFTYDFDGGPNCANSGLCVNQGRNYNIKYTNDAELNTVIDNEYTLLSENAKRETGDLILYKDSNGNSKHIATYIDEDIIFTKNGISKFYPYIFQRKETVEKIYFPKEEFQQVVYRPIIAVETISSKMARKRRIITDEKKSICLENYLRNFL